MDLVKEVREQSRFKLYLAEYFVTNADGDYVFGETVIPNRMVEFVASTSTGLRILNLETGVRVVLETKTIWGRGGEFFVIYKDDPYQQVYIPTRLVKKIGIREQKDTILTPQYSPAESR